MNCNLQFIFLSLCFILFVLSVFFCAFSEPSVAKTNFMIHDFHQLPNGLAIVGERDPDARSTTLGFWVKTGARDEDLQVSGVSHFLEHMMFKGTLARSPEQINLEFDAMGARYNAFTSEEETVFYGAVLPEFAPRLLELLGDMMRPALRNGDFDMEKKVIIEEIAMYDDRPMSKTWEALKSLYFGAHPLGQSVIGSVQSISDLERDAMMNYFQTRYAPDNTALVITGQYDFEAMVAGAEKACGAWEKQDAPRVYSDVSPGSGVEIVTKPEISRAHIALMGPGFSAQDARRHAAALACEIVGGGSNSRLYWALVHPGLAEAASMGHDAQDGVGAFYGFAVARPERASQVLKIWRDEVENACANGANEDELQRAKRKFAAALTLRAETPMGRMRPVGYDWLYRKQQTSTQDLLNQILAISLAQVNEVLATKPFENPAIVGYGPLENL